MVSIVLDPPDDSKTLNAKTYRGYA